jgi:selenophosphate synthetase-related protein
MRAAADIAWIRDALLGMDDIARPVMGIWDWDAAACVEFEGRLVASTDGPYAKRLVMRSALVHAATDVAVKGARPLFALDNMAGPRGDVEEMVLSLRVQAEVIGVPVLGGNTMIGDVVPNCCITVIGRLLTAEPIRDRGAKPGDAAALVGEPLWGKREERLKKAKTLLEAWYEALGKVRFSSSKDVTKGGLAGAVREMEGKSGTGFRLDGGIPYHMGRNLDNFLVTLPESEYAILEGVCARRGCPLLRIGKVT